MSLPSSTSVELSPSGESELGGRYQLVQQLAVGGMAEIFLARQLAPDGFEKDVVIKRLKPELARDARILDMFHDEACISAQLKHPHAVHVFDSGIQDGLPFMAMERIDGRELNVVCRLGLEWGQFLPLEHAVELIRQAALSLGYFHNLRDPAGEELELIHCDISPNNLLVASDGYLQVIDFGIGQFRGQRYREAALVPGKLSYMSPEQARRERLDRRSDIYSLGIILYEITLGRRLFRGPSSEVFERIASGQVQPPTFVRQDYPGALESIVMRALEPAPSDRFQDAYDLADALGEYLREERMKSGILGIARYLDRLHVAMGQQRREELISEAELAGEDETLDFDRDRFSGFEVMAAADPDTAAAWEDFAEDEHGVAEALGIDVSLVRTSSRAPTQPSLRKLHEHAPTATSVEGAPAQEVPAPASLPERKPEIPQKAAASGWLWLVVGLALGAAGSYVLNALG